jgi:hypothetical protein
LKKLASSFANLALTPPQRGFSFVAELPNPALHLVGLRPAGERLYRYPDLGTSGDVLPKVR